MSNRFLLRSCCWRTKSSLTKASTILVGRKSMELGTNFDTFDPKETHLGYLVKKCRISIDLDRAFRLMSEHAHTVRLCPLSSDTREKDSYKFDAKSAWFETWIPCKLPSTH